MKNTNNNRRHRSAGQCVCIAVASCLLSGILNASDPQGRISSDMKQDSNKQTTPAVAVKKEVYATSPEPGVGVSVSMYYIGRGCLREAIRSLLRTSDLSDTPQRRRSDDDGYSLSKIEDIKYNTGESLYSPASISSTIRSSLNGRLYWVGNISSTPVKGNAPRYPLYIVEIDENSHSFIKETLTTIDDRNPAEDSEFLQLSNFSVLEDCKTHSIEIYLTRLGQRGEGRDLWSSDAYKYTISILK